MVDANVLLDVMTSDPAWGAWSGERIEQLADSCTLVINQAIYAEVSVGFERIEDLESALPETYVTRESIPWEAAFLAAKCFVNYRRRGGLRSSPLPDFFIGAHALVRGMRLLTRDAARYRTYFPRLELIAPPGA